MRSEMSRFRWVIFMSVLFTYLMMSSQRTAPGLITDQLIMDFNVSATTIGLVASVQFFVYSFLQVPVGILVDRYGPNFMLISGVFLTGLGTLVYSLGSDVAILFFSRILTGVGDATIWIGLVLILSHWFTAREFSRLIGVAGMTGSLGFLLATVPYSSVIVLIGWRKAFFSVGLLLCFLSLVLYWILVKIPRQPLLIKKELTHEQTLSQFKGILMNKQAWALFLCHFGLVGTFLGFIGSWAVPFMLDTYQLSRLAASQIIMFSLIGALIGAPIIGWVSSCWGRIKRLYITFHLITIACWFCILFYQGHPSFGLFSLLFVIIGFSFGANSLTFTLVRQTFPLEKSGMVSGFANTGGFLSAVLLPSFFGYMLDYAPLTSAGAIHGYYFGFFAPFLFSLSGLVGILMVKEEIS